MLRIKTQWICCALLLFLLLVNNTEAKAQSADELINEYRAWMAEHYPRPEGMDTETLFRTTLWAIYDRQREPEVKTLLRAAAQKVPELQAYADWLDSGKSDPCSEAGTRALQALTRASGEQLGSRHLTTAWCRLLLSIQLSTTQDVTAQVDQLIKDLQQPTTGTDRERLSLLCAARLSQFTNRLWDRFVEDPETYPELLKTEQEVLTLYPVQSETDRAGSPHPLPRPIGNRRPHPGLPLLPAGRSQVRPEPSGGSQLRTRPVWLAEQYRIFQTE